MLSSEKDVRKLSNPDLLKMPLYIEALLSNVTGRIVNVNQLKLICRECRSIYAIFPFCT